MVLFVEQAAIWLSVGAILGIPISFLFGVIDDKFGTPVACLVMGITELLPVIGLMTQGAAVAKTGACNVPMLLVWGVGVACMTGGVPTMHPASISFAFGRREYQSANRIIMAIQLIPCSFGASIMMALIQTGKGMLAWGGVLAVVILVINFVLPMINM